MDGPKSVISGASLLAMTAINGHLPQDIAAAIYTIAAGLGGGILVLLPVYQKVCSVLRDESIKDQQAGIHHDGSAKDRLEWATARIADLEKEVDQWRQIAESRPLVPSAQPTPAPTPAVSPPTPAKPAA